MSQIRFKRLFVTSLDEIISEVNNELQSFDTEGIGTEVLSQIIFGKLVGNGVKSRIISYNFNNQTLFSVQYYDSGRWINFDYKGLDLKFHPIFSFTLNPTKIIEEQEGY